LIIPVRCFTCGKLVGDRWEEFARRVKAGEKPKNVLDDMGMTRYCCRRMFISQVDVIDDLLRYAQVTAKRRAQFE
jgi:DNA-directed RNA polymerase subunit N